MDGGHSGEEGKEGEAWRGGAFTLLGFRMSKTVSSAMRVLRRSAGVEGMLDAAWRLSHLFMTRLSCFQD